MNGKVGKACRYIGCPTIGYERHSYCPKHAHLANTGAFGLKHQKRLALYNTAAWRRMRRYIIGLFPLCQRCDREASTVVHHIKSARQFPDLQLEPSNLEALCASCHNKESQVESLRGRELKYG